MCLSVEDLDTDTVDVKRVGTVRDRLLPVLSARPDEPARAISRRRENARGRVVLTVAYRRLTSLADWLLSRLGFGGKPRPVLLRLALSCLVVAAASVVQAGPAPRRDDAKPRGQSLPTRIPVGDSAAMCPAGDRTVMFLLLFRTSPSTIDAVFPMGGEQARLERIAAGSFRGDDLRRLVAHRARLPLSAFPAGPATCAFFKKSIATAFLTDSGAGVAVSARSDSNLVALSICTLVDSTTVSAGGSWRLREDDVLELPVRLDGDAYLLTLRAAAMADSEVEKATRAFRTSVMKLGGGDQKAIWPRPIPRKAASCLGLPSRR